MRIFVRALILAWCSVFLSACGGGSNNSGSGTPGTLAAGSSFTMTANSTVKVPAGTTVTTPNGSVITVNGSSNTVITQVGAVVQVPASATGPAVDTVTTVGSAGAAGAALSATSIAGSATVSGTPVDGTGTAAVFWGGGHLAIDLSGNVILSDRGELRKVTPAGVVTTLTTQGGWDGVAIDSAGNAYGSGGGSVIGVSPVTWGASLYEFSASGVYQTLFANWESSSATSSVGFGGLVMDSKGALFLADQVGQRIVKLNIGSNTWAVFAGSGASGNQGSTGTPFSFTASPDLAIDSNDNLYVRNLDTILKIAPDGTITTIATQLPRTSTIAVDKSGNVYTSDSQVIYRIASNGNVVAYSFANTMDAISSLAIDSNGNLYAGTRGLGAQIFKITFPR